jgi:hypothetical protein
VNSCPPSRVRNSLPTLGDNSVDGCAWIRGAPVDHSVATGGQFGRTGDSSRCPGGLSTGPTQLSAADQCGCPHRDTPAEQAGRRPSPESTTPTATTVLLFPKEEKQKPGCARRSSSGPTRAAVCPALLAPFRSEPVRSACPAKGLATRRSTVEPRESRAAPAACVDRAGRGVTGRDWPLG